MYVLGFAEPIHPLALLLYRCIPLRRSLTALQEAEVDTSMGFMRIVGSKLIESLHAPSTATIISVFHKNKSILKREGLPS